MDKYKKYMDGVEGSSAFRDKLNGLAPASKGPLWTKYAAVAAGLALVLGLGGWGLTRLDSGIELGGKTGSIPAVELAPLPSGEQVNSVLIGGGYELIDDEVASYYILPYIDYQTQMPGTAADYSLAALGSASREVTKEDVIRMVGSQDDLIDHLGWDDSLTWGGILWIGEDGSPCAASLYATGADVHFGIEMMEGGEIPDCVVLPEGSYQVTEFFGVKIRGLKEFGWRVDEDGTEMRESRKVSFFANDTGYKLTIYGTDAERVEDLAARFVRWAIVEGFSLDGANPDGAVPVYSQENGSDGEQGISTPAYDPSAES